MQRRVGSVDAERAMTLMKSSVEYGFWSVCEDYDLRGEEIVARWPYKEFRFTERWWAYRPLDWTPGMFLHLAELNKEPDFLHAALEFCRSYGLMGNMPPSQIHPIEKMNLSDLRREADTIAEVIEIYERALNGDETLVQIPPVDLGMPGPAGPPDSYTDHTLTWAVAVVTERVQSHCRPTLYLTGDYFRPGTAISGIRNTWEFDNLIGAAYLQVWWLMASGGEVARCEYCRRSMSLARPKPESRKRRRDKRFCSDSCRQAHHRSRKQS